MNIFKNILLLIISPRVGWEEIEHSSCDTERVLSTAFYPLLAVLAVSCFVPMLYDSTTHTLSSSLMQAIVSFSKYLITYFIASFLLTGFYPELTKSELGVHRMNNYIVYVLIFLILLSIIINLIPGQFSPLYFLMLYAVLIAYRGIDFLGVKPGKELKFIVVATILIVAMPQALDALLNMLIQ